MKAESTKMTTGSPLFVVDTEYEENTDANLRSRRHFMGYTLTTLLLPAISNAFEGGVGGLGKTKPELGVELLTPATQSGRDVTAEIVVDEAAYLVSLQSSWPLLTTGVQVRDVRNPESVFLQVIPDLSTKQPWTKAQVIQNVLQENILNSQGKFGAYGAPTNIKVKNTADNAWLVTFTALTPGLRESDRRLVIRGIPLQSSWIAVVGGTTLQRFTSQESILRRTIDSVQIVAAPKTSLKRRNKEDTFEQE